jgi:N-ethylmaleimide reductase
MSSSHLLYQPYQLGSLTLANRMVMAPLTRSRANERLEPTALSATYYGQRAGAGLIITEATQVSPTGQGYMATPGIFTDGQVAGWRQVADAVHAKGGKICMQLWHVGRISHTFFQPGNAAPLAPSAVRAMAKVFIPSGFDDVSEPRAVTIEEIRGLVETFAQGAINAKQAGMDMVEVHAANGYLIDQFLRDKTNQRTDGYGGSIENRTRFLLEVIDAVCRIYPAAQVGCRISPASTFNDIDDSNPQPLYLHVARELGKRGLGYLHIIEGETGGPRDARPEVDFGALKRAFKEAGGIAVMANNGYSREMAEQAVADGSADVVALGVPFLANPDLVERFRHGRPLNAPDVDTFYGGTEKGYTDYPEYRPA